MKHVFMVVTILGTLMFLAAPGVADWIPEDGHKMHWPQMPDPNGWDIDMTAPNVVADDWLCTEPGPVRDIHFWYSVQGDFNVDPDISGWEKIHVSIHEDIPVDAATPYSRPGLLLWERDFVPGEFNISPKIGTGFQGWADPAMDPPDWNEFDHIFFYQVNIPDIPDPFYQEGTATDQKIYWLDLSVEMKTEAGVDYPRVGWKTTFPQVTPGQTFGGWGDDAVYRDVDDNGNVVWQELWEYNDPGLRSLDMAFVITPEPGTITMLVSVGLAGLFAFVRRRGYRRT